MAIAEVDRIVVRGKDLCRDVIGQQSFTAYFLFLLTGETPSDNLVRVADATMVSLAEHGLVPSVGQKKNARPMFEPMFRQLD